MSYTTVTIDVDVDDVLSEIDTQDLLKEIKTRYDIGKDVSYIQEWGKMLNVNIDGKVFQSLSVVDEIKIQSFMGKINNFSLEELEKRLT